MKTGWNKMMRVAVAAAVCLWAAMPEGYAGGNAARMERARSRNAAFVAQNGQVAAGSLGAPAVLGVIRPNPVDLLFTFLIIDIIWNALTHQEPEKQEDKADESKQEKEASKM